MPQNAILSWMRIKMRLGHWQRIRYRQIGATRTVQMICAIKKIVIDSHRIEINLTKTRTVLFRSGLKEGCGSRTSQWRCLNNCQFLRYTKWSSERILCDNGITESWMKRKVFSDILTLHVIAPKLGFVVIPGGIRLRLNISQLRTS